MTSLISLLKEIEIKGKHSILLKNLEWDDDIDSSYPISKENNIRRIPNKINFKWWKEDMTRYYGENLVLYKIINPDKKFFYHGKYKLIVPKSSNPENQKYWND